MLRLLPTLSFSLIILFSHAQKGHFEQMQPVIEQYLDDDLDSAQKFASILLEHATKEQNFVDEHHAYNYLGHIAYREGKKFDALTYFQKSLTIRYQYGKPSEISNSNNWIGRIYHETGNFDEATEYYLKALAASSNVDDRSYELQATNNLSKLYLDINLLDQLDKHNLLAIELGKEIGDSLEYANALNLRGIYFQEKEQYDSSANYFQQALDLYEHLNEKSRVAQSYNNLGIVLFFYGKHHDAYQNFLRATVIRQHFNDSTYYAQSLGNLGDYHYFYQQLDSAKYYFLKAIQVAQLSYAYYDEMEFHESLAKVYAEQKDFENAYSEMCKYGYIKETIFDQNLSNALRETEEKLLFDKQKQQMHLISTNNDRINSINAELSNAVTSRNWLIYSLSFAIICLVGYFFLKMK